MSKPTNIFKILIVDDSLVARRMLVSQLIELGYKSIDGVTNGTEGMQKLNEAQKGSSPYDLIITDLRMPCLDGIEFMQAIAENPVFKAIPLLVASVETERGTLLNTVLAGADGYILKPTTTEVLKAKLVAALQKKRSA